MRPLLDTYGLPHRLPVVFRIVILMLAIPAVGIALWLILPHTPAVVGLLVLYVLAAVAGGLWRISTARELNRPPGRNPQPPPSAS
jgi:hypothetical protein